MSVLTVAEVKTHLNIVGAVSDAEIQTFIDACEDAVAEKCGPLTSVARTERVKGGGAGLVLTETPVVSLTSVTPVNGSAISLTLLNVEKSAGVVEWLSGACFQTGWYDVVTQAGRASLPNDMRLGIKELIRHVWDTQRGSGGRPGGRSSEALSNTVLASAYTWPNRVTELLAPYIQVGN